MGKECTIHWCDNTVTPKEKTKCFVIWVDADAIHTAIWIGDKWVTSAGYYVYGMNKVKYWAEQPDKFW